MPIPISTLDELRELVAECRKLGVVRLKTGETELMLGEDPAKAPKAPREKPLEVREHFAKPTQTSAGGTPRSEAVMFPGQKGRG